MTDKIGRFSHKSPRMKVGITCRIAAAFIAVPDNSGQTGFVGFNWSGDAEISWVENCENESQCHGWKGSCSSGK